MFFDFRYHMYKLSFVRTYTHARMSDRSFIHNFILSTIVQSRSYNRTYNRSRDVLLHKLLTKTDFFFGSGFDEEIAEYKF